MMPHAPSSTCLVVFTVPKRSYQHARVFSNPFQRLIALRNEKKTLSLASSTQRTFSAVCVPAVCRVYRKRQLSWPTGLQLHFACARVCTRSRAHKSTRRSWQQQRQRLRTRVSLSPSVHTPVPMSALSSRDVCVHKAVCGILSFSDYGPIGVCAGKNTSRWRRSLVRANSRLVEYSAATARALC